MDMDINASCIYIGVRAQTFYGGGGGGGRAGLKDAQNNQNSHSYAFPF